MESFKKPQRQQQEQSAEATQEQRSSRLAKEQAQLEKHLAQLSKEATYKQITQTALDWGKYAGLTTLAVVLARGDGIDTESIMGVIGGGMTGVSAGYFAGVLKHFYGLYQNKEQ